MLVDDGTPPLEADPPIPMSAPPATSKPTRRTPPAVLSATPRPTRTAPLFLFSSPHTAPRSTPLPRALRPLHPNLPLPSSPSPSSSSAVVKRSPSTAALARLTPPLSRSSSITTRPRKPTSLTLLTTHLDAEQTALVTELIFLLSHPLAAPAPPSPSPLPPSTHPPPPPLAVHLTSTFSPSVTHLITPASSPTSNLLLTRTHKYFLSLLAGAYVVTIDWVAECLTQGRVVDAGEWVVEGDRVGRGGARRARERKEMGGGGLFEGWEVEGGWGVWGREETKRDVRSLVEAGGGEWVEGEGGRWGGEAGKGGEGGEWEGEEGRRRVVVLDDSKERVKVENRRLLTASRCEEWKRAGVWVVTTTWLFACISHFAIQPAPDDPATLLDSPTQHTPPPIPHTA